MCGVRATQLRLGARFDDLLSLMKEETRVWRAKCDKQSALDVDFSVSSAVARFGQKSAALARRRDRRKAFLPG